MINSKFLTTSASRLANRIESETGNDAELAKKIEAAYWLTFSRSPSPAESQASEQHLQHLEKLFTQSGTEQTTASRHAFENFVHMLLCANEFLYVD
jgi:hypothetical protein